MARKPNYDYEKRRKEIERKQKQEEKRQRRRENAGRQSEDGAEYDPTAADPSGDDGAATPGED